jgi:hypothetical protein
MSTNEDADKAGRRMSATSLDLRDVDPERRASVAEDHLTAAIRAWKFDQRRPPALTAREALAALQFEALLVWTAAHNTAAGMALSDSDLARLTLSARWIERIAREAGS